MHVCLNIHVHVHVDFLGALLFLKRQQINLKKNNTESGHFLGIDNKFSRKKIKNMCERKLNKLHRKRYNVYKEEIIA